MMTRSTMKFIKGMGFGMVAGCAAGITGLCYWKQHRKGMKKNVSKALRNVSELVENVNGMF